MILFTNFRVLKKLKLEFENLKLESETESTNLYLEHSGSCNEQIDSTGMQAQIIPSNECLGDMDQQSDEFPVFPYLNSTDQYDQYDANYAGFLSDESDESDDEQNDPRERASTGDKVENDIFFDVCKIFWL